MTQSSIRAFQNWSDRLLEMKTRKVMARSVPSWGKLGEPVVLLARRLAPPVCHYLASVQRTTSVVRVIECNMNTRYDLRSRARPDHEYAPARPFADSHSILRPFANIEY